MAPDIIEHNPLLKKPLLTILSLSEHHPDKDRTSLEQAALQLWTSTYQQSPTVAVDILVRNGALSEQIYVNGTAYAGTLEDIQLAVDVPDNAVAKSYITITAFGQDLLNAHSADNTLRTLFASKHHYQAIFAAILEACSAKNGCTLTYLEQIINAQSPLTPDSKAGQAPVYPQYFIDALESTGGITWQNAWHTTDVGKSIITA